MIVAEHGWAVRFLLDAPGVRQWVWVNYGGGYSPSRRYRAVFASRWEAEEAAYIWRAHPLLKVVRVNYCAQPSVPTHEQLRRAGHQVSKDGGE